MLGVETVLNIEGPPAFLNSDLFDADDDSDEEVVTASRLKQSRHTKKQRLILSDDDDDETNNVASALPISARDDTSSDKENDDEPYVKKGRTKPAPLDSDSEEEEDKADDGSQNGSGDEGKQEDSSDGSGSSSSNSDGSEGEDEGEIAFQLSPGFTAEEQKENGDGRPSRRRRINKDELQQIHSETQRIVRESSIRIPYHRPKPLSLDELFSKKPSPAALKPIRGKVPRILGSQQHSTFLQPDNSQLEDKTQAKTDELPDIFSQTAHGTQMKGVECHDSKDTQEANTGIGSKESKDNGANGNNVCEGGDSDEAMQMETDERSDAQKEESSESMAVEQISEAMPSDTSMHEEEHAAEPASHAGSESTLKLSQHAMPSQHSTPSQHSKPSQHSPKDSTVQASQALFKTPSPAPAKLASSESAQARRMRLLQESLSKIKGMKPKLSGSPQATIDLDEGAEPSKEQMGMEKLMMRFELHTRHVTPLHKKDVQVNIVTKEKGVDGKEDLKHHTLTVGLDGKSDDTDPALNVPGAKLTKLKETLSTGIRARREEERKKRVQAFHLDNEEGFGGGEDEDEAELTDGSETDDDDGDDGDAVVGRPDDEDDDADYEPGNEFVDDEAESDDDDDDEYERDDDSDDDVMVSASKKNSKLTKKVSKLSTKGRKSSLDSEDDEDEISPSRRKSSQRRAMVVDDEEEVGDNKRIHLRLNSVETDDTDAELTDGLHDSGRFLNGSLGSRPVLVHDQCSKTMEMFDSATNSTVTSDIHAPYSKADSTAKKVSWSAGKDTDSSRDDSSFALPAPVRQDSSSNSMDISFDLMTSLIPAHQPEGGMRRSGRASVDSNKDGFTPFARHQSILNNTSTKSPPHTGLNPLTMPVEDSQDLFREDSPTLPTITDSETVGESQSFHFSFVEDETQTQFLDENGLLNLKPSSDKRQSKAKPMFGTSQAQSTESQGSMDELLGLCSGKFTETQGKNKESVSTVGPFSQVSQKAGTQANMDELLDLCSGTFTEPNAKSQITSTRKMDDENDDDDDTEEKNSTASFHIMSDPDGSDSDDDVKNRHFSSDDEDEDDVGVRRRKKRKGVSDDDEDDEEEEGNEEKENEAEDSDLDSEFAFDVNRKAFKGKTYGKKMNLANFLEDEAELSGSELGSDEDYDAEDEPDEEDLEGIVTEETGDQEELRNQVNKVHMKTMDDDDARRLRLMKEMYLPDGDLHSDNKRMRRFRWKNIDSQMDMFRPDSEGEENEDDAQQDQDTQWRLQRYEREQWLKENEGKEPVKEITPEEIVTVEEDSQFAKCLRTASFRKPRVEISSPEVDEKKEKENEKKEEKKVSTPKPLKIMTKRGSFLNRSKNDLAKMASMLKPIGNPQGPRNNRNFVFQSAESVMNEDSNTASEAPKVKRSASVTGHPSTQSPAGPQAKRPRLERSQSQYTSNSVFRHF